MVFQHIMAVISGFIPRSRRPVWVASPCDSTSWFPKDVAVASGDRMPTACDWCPVVLGAAGVAEIRRVFRDGQFCLTYSHHSSAIFSPLHDDIDKTWDTWGRRSHFSASSPRSWKTIKKGCDFAVILLGDVTGMMGFHGESPDVGLFRLSTGCEVATCGIAASPLGARCRMTGRPVGNPYIERVGWT